MTLIVCAMMDEAKSLSEDLNLIENKIFPIYEGKISNQHVLLVVTGVGKTNAAAGTTYVISKFNVDKIINPGIAGGHKVVKFGSYVIQNASYHDFDLTIFNYEMGQVPGCPAKFSTKLNDLEKLNMFSITNLYTGDKFATTTINHEAYVSDMEGAAIYQVANKFNIDVIALKIVSDVIGSVDQLDNYKELESSFDVKIKEEVIKILEVL